ncbi:MAG: class I tRNA ligase family protein, partial [Bacteroidetes bacterium]|nr:class I tRNA ligase family protein [Bacteroidota bacterium]
GHQIPAYYIQGTNEYVVGETAEEALEKAIQKTGNANLSMSDLEQDPDVLDTWASSWLWPISVFKGIMEPENPEFQYYYPTNDLVTAPEILFFWVARMIIAGYEYTGQKPFTNVYLHGIVRDDKRRKMSKSLGNSPDPLDLIAEYGADAVRVGMLLSAPAGNDLLFKISLVEQGRNFANKLWNGYRLVKTWETADTPPTEMDKIALEWMEAYLNAVAEEIKDHFEKFRLSDALMSVYKLLWDDFCNWFLELIKPAQGQSVSQETYDQVVLLFEKGLQLAHPFIPFITEEVWQGLTDRNDTDFISVETLFTAEEINQSALKDMELIRTAITDVRAFWNDQKSRGGGKGELELYIKTDRQEVFEKNLEILKKFLRTDLIHFSDEKPENTGSIRVGTTEIFIPLPEVDTEAEIEKIKGEIAHQEGFLKGVMKKLGNERFVANAPEDVVEKERKKQSDAEARLKVLRESLAELEG